MAGRAETVRIGVLSDTHLPHRLQHLPDSVVEVFATAATDLILHAGDVNDLRCLEPLSHVAPIIAVQGNAHLQDLSRGGAELPYHVELVLCGRRLILTHGHWRGVIGLWGNIAVAGAYQLGLLSRERINRCIAQRLCRRFPRADVVVFGHSHEPFQAWLGGTFVFNPGAVCPTLRRATSVGRLYLGPDTIEAEVIPLVSVLVEK